MNEQDSLRNIWPEWVLKRVIGKGSYGCVYEAVRTEHNVESRAAIKIISLSKSIGPDYQLKVNEFVNEIKLMESLKGTQNIVSVEDYKVVEDPQGTGCTIFIRMELLTPLTMYIEKTPLSRRSVIKLGIDILKALELCVKRGIIHRDVKPGNIFVNDFGDFKLGDFGAAKDTRDMPGTMVSMGTYNYMAPEVAAGEFYDASVDIYSLGIVMYRFLNDNRLPFVETDRGMTDPEERRRAVERRLGGEPIPPPSKASGGLATVILRACSPNPKNRFTNPQEMRKALMAQINGNNYDDDLDRTVSVRQARPAGYPSDEIHYTPNGGKKSKGPVILGILAAIALVMVICVCGIILFKGKKDDDSSKDDKTATEEVADKDEDSSDGKSDDAEDDIDVSSDDEEAEDDGSSDETVTDNDETDETPDDDKDTDKKTEAHSREKFDKLIEQYANKYTDADFGGGVGRADRYYFIQLDNEETPELVICNRGDLAVVTPESKSFGQMRRLPAQLFYLKGGNKILKVGRYAVGTGVHYPYDYYKIGAQGFVEKDELSGEIWDDKGTMIYHIGIYDIPTEEEFVEELVEKYGKLTEVPLDRDDMYTSIEEAADAYWKETFENGK